MCKEQTVTLHNASATLQCICTHSTSATLQLAMHMHIQSKLHSLWHDFPIKRHRYRK